MSALGAVGLGPVVASGPWWPWRQVASTHVPSPWAAAWGDDGDGEQLGPRMPGVKAMLDIAHILQIQELLAKVVLVLVNDCNGLVKQIHLNEKASRASDVCGVAA